MFKTFYSTSDWRNDLFFLEHWLFWIQSNFQATKKKQTCQIKMLYTEQTFAPRAFHSALQQQTNTVNTQKSPPWACDKGCAEACAERFSALKLPMVPEVLTKVHSAQFPSFSFLKWRIAMPLIIERSLSIVNGLCKVADSDYQVSKRSILDSAGKGRLSLKKNTFLRLCWFHFGLKIKRGPGQLDPSPR